MANNVKEQSATLYVVATPIGNLEDITLRAINVLKSVDLIASEDTRIASILLNKYSIETKLISCHKYSENSKTKVLLDYLKQGKSIALICDQGTPLISDPGAILVKEAIKENIKVTPIVGACALIALLSSVFRKDEDFKFIGFLPRVKKQIIETVSKNRHENLVFYESPNRFLDTLEAIYSAFPNKQISFGRELTKKFEEIKTKSLSDALEHFKTNPLKGEFVVLLHKDEKEKEEQSFEEKIEQLKSLGYKNKEIAAILSVLFNANKNSIYKECLKAREN